MSLETSTPTAEPTADAGATPDTGTAPETAQPTAEPAAQPRPERTFTQADIDRIAQNERERAKRWYERELERSRSEAQPPADPLMRDLASLKQDMVAFKLDQAIASVRTRHADLQDDAKLREVLDIVVQKGLDRVTHLSIDEVLDTAYRYWAHDELVKRASQPPVDVEKIRKEATDQAIKDYLAKKTATSAATPKVEGPGGGTPANPNREVRRTRKGAFDAALERVTKSRALTD